jgi:hypothetical protein
MSTPEVHSKRHAKRRLTQGRGSCLGSVQKMNPVRYGFFAGGWRGLFAFADRLRAWPE